MAAATSLNSKTPYTQMKDSHDESKFSASFPSKNLQIVQVQTTYQKARAEYNDTTKILSTKMNRLVMIQDGKLRYTLHVYAAEDRRVQITSTGPAQRDGSGKWKRVEVYHSNDCYEIKDFKD